MQFSPKGGNEMAQVSSDDAKSTPHLTYSEQSPAKRGCEEKGRRSEHSAVFAARWKRNGANFFTPLSSEQSPAKRVCEEKEEGESIMEFSPQGGNGMARTSSDAVRRMCSCLPRVIRFIIYSAAARNNSQHNYKRRGGVEWQSPAEVKN